MSTQFLISYTIFVHLDKLMKFELCMCSMMVDR